jgi:DmsE family decaheme c-type cytochrome/MtrB/PioB family decaheme-associated outer membrane protein
VKTWRVLLLIGLFALVCLASSSRAQSPVAEGYVGGAEPCKLCHPRQFAAFAATKMGMVFLGSPRNAKEASGCEACHGPSAAHVASAGAQRLNPFIAFTKRDATPTAQRNAVCLQCHTQGATALWHGSIHDNRKLACSDCHAVHGGNAKRLAEATQQQLCTRCHQQIKSALMKPSHHPLREEKMTCTSCHNPHGAQAERLIAASTVNDKCYECHADKRGPFLWEHPPSRESCLNCHNSHGSSHGPLLISKPPLLCQKCHSNQNHPSTLYALNTADATAGRSVYTANVQLFYRGELPRAGPRQQSSVGQILPPMNVTRSSEATMSTRIGADARCLLLAVAIAVAQSSAAAASSDDRAAAAPGDAAQEQTTQRPAQEPPTVDAGASAADAAAAVTPTAVSPPSWLPSTRNVEFRLRPNAGIRLPLLSPNVASVAREDATGQIATPWSIRGSLAAMGIDNERESAKFQEYRDLRDGAAVEAHFRDGGRLLNVVGRHLGLRDQDLAVDGGQAGKYLVSFGFSETPHNYSFNSRSLFDGLGTGLLTISDRIQADLQSSATAQEAADKIRNYQEQSAQTTDVDLRRSKAGVDFTLLAAYPFTIRAAASNEARTGVRPSMGSFGLGNFEELPWPVAFDTRDARVSLDYAKPESKLFASATYRASLFDNHQGTQRFDNPYRITDTSTGSVGATFAAGPSDGLIVLPPSNTAQEVSATSTLSRLPHQTSLSALVSMSFLRQNQPLVAYSTNNAAVLPSGLNATDLAALPRQSADTAMNTTLAQLRLTTQVVGPVRLVGQYRFFDLANHEAPFTIAGFIRTDADLRRPATPGGTYAPVLAAYNRHTASVEGSVNLPANSRVALSYTFERMNRDFREVSWMNDNRVKVSFDAHPASRLDVTTSYQRSMRDTSDYTFDQYNVAQGNPLESPMLPLLRKFDEAARDGDDAQVMATLQVSEGLSLSGSALYGHDAYSKSLFGLLDDSHRVYSLDAAYSVSEQLSVYASYSFERYFSLQKARQWSPTSVSNPYTGETGPDSNSNWEARPRDEVDVASVAVDAYLIPRRLRLNVAYTYTRSRGSIAYASPIGVAANDVNAFDPGSFPELDMVPQRESGARIPHQRAARAVGRLPPREMVDRRCQLRRVHLYAAQPDRRAQRRPADGQLSVPAVQRQRRVPANQARTVKSGTKYEQAN